MNFNGLPVEIIRMIFYIHVYEHIGSKRMLLRTCRTWYNVASNYPMLWRAIHWHFRDLGSTVDPDDQCLNLNDLAQAIRRTGTVTFDLVFRFPDVSPSKVDQKRFSVEVDPEWLSRCHSLSLYHGFSNSVQSMVDGILNPMDRGLPSLEHLSISETRRYPWGGALDMLISRVADSSTNLQSLELSGLGKDLGIEVQVFRFPEILRRIRRLRIRDIEHVPWAEFPDLEHLDYAIILFIGSTIYSKSSRRD